MLRERWRFHLQGVVQGVGFRPYVFGLAERFGLVGFVGNNSAGVFIEVEGESEKLDAFQQGLLRELPPLAYVEDCQQSKIPIVGEKEFLIIESHAENGLTLISPDLTICDDCLRELFDSQNRRYRYPFINCTNCGPRFTIIRALPYDRPNTTMANFALCPDCAAEYANPHDRRFHAQPIACPDCGPQLEFVADGLNFEREDALQAARQALLEGKILAVKGLGGFHLACDATNAQAVAMLRERKGRREKPFALMLYNLAEAEKIAYINAEEAELLQSRQRPIVLLKKRDSIPIVEAVAPKNPHLGIMLPYTPLHYLLLHDLGIPLVMTSGNLSEEPIITENAIALEKLARIADAFLLHNRPIHLPCDDSVLYSEMPLRRSRGYAPFPVKLPFAVPPILAVGGELKNTFCIAQDNRAFMSQHIGDMENLETLAAFERSFELMSATFKIQPELVACDMHPNYLSTRWAQNYAEKQGIPLVAVQHHHAHIAAVMAENGIREAVLGISFDGTGYGTDGAIWGGEILRGSYASFERVAHLEYLPIAGGDASIKKPYRMALAALWAAGIAWDEDLAPVQACPKIEREILRQQLERKLNTVSTSSMGRLFDAVASLLGIRQTVTYEAQAAIELEALSIETDDLYEFAYSGNAILLEPVLRAILGDLRTGLSKAEIAGKFQQSILMLIVEMARRYDMPIVALSGGVLQNRWLHRRAKQALEAGGFRVVVHRQVPANDAGLALGQVAIAADIGHD